MSELLQRPADPAGRETPADRVAAPDAPATQPDRPDAQAGRAGRAALARACEHLLAQQDPAGWWKGELASNVTMEAEDLLLRQFLGIRTAELTAATARWIRSQQRPDGAWATFHNGSGDLSTTIEAYAALRLAGDPVDAPHLAAAAGFVRSRGGIEASRVFTRIWLAMFGQWPWHQLPAIPPELVYLPYWLPFNIYDFACWARQTIVPLSILRTLRPVRDLGFTLAELRTGAPPAEPPRLLTRAGALHRLDRLAAGYGRIAPARLRQRALRAAASWVVARQEADGSWGGIQPPWVYSLMALHALGHPLDHPVLRAGLAGLQRFTVTAHTPQGTVRRLEACQSPVWDTALAVAALADAGLPVAHPALVRAGRWLLGEEVRIRGDWRVRRPGLPAGGWAFEFDNDHYPDTDDTAEVLLALRRCAVPAGPAVRRGLVWLLGMQSRDGGWAAFDADNTRQLVAGLPFCDFGEVIDPPSADVTAHVVEALCAEGLGHRRAVRRGLGWLLRTQEPDGSWFGRWGANYVYGTGAVVPALIAAGLGRRHPAVRRAVHWLLAHQNPDGGWGEDIRSYRDPAWIGRGESTASQTAWALLALHAAGQAGSRAAGHGVRWLAATQRADGGWDEPQYTGTGFPGDFSINYGLYRLVFPIAALGRIVHSAGRWS
jgi:squalene-hopene/tetraprenyl-beta-curcumene cyclase